MAVRVYVASVEDIHQEIFYDDLTDAEFIELAFGNYSLYDFQVAFNQESISTNTDVIRIIETE